MEVRAASDWPRRDPASVMEAIAAAGIVAVLRASDADRFEQVAEVLVETGVTCVEFTLTSRGAVEALRRFAARLPAGVTLGAGTVLEPTRPTRPSTPARATLSRQRSTRT
jgi:2-keto-3-deoxy-6-phosphogluconate aldolase